MEYATRPIRLSKDTTALTEELCVDDRQMDKRYVVVIQRVDFRSIHTPIIHGVARFTASADAPTETGDILMRTPEYYRRLESGDKLDGAQAANFAPLVAAQLRELRTSASEHDFTARAAIASAKDPWILCTSIKPSCAAGARSLEQQFFCKGPDAVVTTVRDHNAFARQLGIDFARSSARKNTEKEDAIALVGRHAYWLACGADKEIDAVVRVVHGPVHYENATLQVRSGSDIASADAHRVWFTKGTDFSGEREYRLAVSAGRPATETVRLAASPELSRRTKSWPYGDRWWSS